MCWLNVAFIAIEWKSCLFHDGTSALMDGLFWRYRIIARVFFDKMGGRLKNSEGEYKWVRILRMKKASLQARFPDQETLIHHSSILCYHTEHLATGNFRTLVVCPNTVACRSGRGGMTRSFGRSCWEERSPRRRVWRSWDFDSLGRGRFAQGWTQLYNAITLNIRWETNDVLHLVHGWIWRP